MNDKERKFTLACEAAEHILGETRGKVSDDDLNSFVLSRTDKALLDTPKQNQTASGNIEKAGRCTVTVATRACNRTLNPHK